METRLVTAAVLAVLVVSTAAPIGSATSSRAASTSSTCNQDAVHDAYRTAEAIQVVNETGEATSTASNTETRVEDVSGFIRLHASNPNGYCVEFTVEISSEIVAPADLGGVDSLDENTTASWRAVQNLSSGELYTQVTFVLPPGGNATFAPSTIRVQSLSWTGKAKDAGSGFISSVTSFFGGNNDLRKRHYNITPQNGEDAITVPLRSSDGRTINEWQATYTIDGETRVITQDANEPVYYTENNEGVTFHFNEENATVDFTANPTFGESVSHSVKTYTSGWESLGDVLPFGVVPEVDL